MANQRLDATISIGSVLERSVGKNLNIIRRGLDGVGDEIKSITNRQKELSKQRKVLERQGRSVDALDREYEQLGRTLDDLRRKQERFERAQGAANRVGRQFQSAVGTIGRQARTVGIAMGAIGTAAVGVTETTANAAREIRLFSQLANSGETEFQRFAAGAKSVGIENDKLSDILKDVNDRIGDFEQTGGGPMADFFEKIGPLVGVTAEDFKDLSGPEALQLYVSSLEKANLSQADMTFYMEAMASDSTALIPLLQDNGKAMGELGDAAERTGQIMSKEALDAAEKYRREMGLAGGALTGVRNIIGAELMPVIGDLAREFTAFVTENRPQIEAFAETLANGLRDAVPIIGDVVSGLGDFAGKVGSVVSKVAEMIGGWENFGIALGVLMTSPAIVAVGGFVVTVGKLAGALTRILIPAINGVGRAFLLNPIGLAIAGIAAGAYLIYENWGSVKDWFSDLWGSVTDIFGGFGDFVGSVFSGDMSGAVDGLKRSWEGVTGFFDSILTGIGGTFTAVWTDLIKPVTDKLGVTEPIVSAWNAARDGIGSAMTWVGDKLTEVKDTYVTPFISLMSDGLSGIAGAWQGVRDAIGGVLDWITEKFATVMDKIKPVIEALTWVRDQGAGAVGAVTGFFGGDAGPSGGSAGRVDERAVGGALAANVPTLVGERGPELIYPNQGGFVAHHRAVERLAQLSAQARTGISAANENAMPNLGRLAAEIGGIGRAVAAAAGAMVLTASGSEAAPLVTFTPPAIQQPAPVVEQQLPPGVTVDPVINVAVPEMASPFVEVAAPVVQMAAPILERVMPVIERAAPVINNIIERAAPVMQQIIPAINLAAPVIEQAAQPAPQVIPVMQQAAPVQMLDFTPQAAEPIPEPAMQPAPAIRQEGARSASVVQNITINAPQNMDVQQLVAELERLKSLAQNDALFDGANDWGQYA